MFMHGCNIAHRDVKLQNILLDANNQIKVCDFDSSASTTVKKAVKDAKNTVLELKRMTTFTGTDGLRAPEIEEEKEYLGP